MNETKTEKFPSISTNDLKAQLQNPELSILDIRSTAAYNGWKINGETRSGHIKGAKSLPLDWTQYWDLPDILDSKEIMPDNPVVIYGYNHEDAMRMAKFMETAGYKNIKIYDGFMSEWVPDVELPMEKLARYTQLVYPEWLKTLIDGGTPPEYLNGKNYVICHPHYGYIKDYEVGHIPGAIPLDTNSLESTETWNRRSPEELKKTFEGLGIRHDTTVILYGRFSFPKNEDPYPGRNAGHLAAMRCAMIMLYAGVKDVRILNGGLRAWEDAGYPITQEETTPTPVSDFGVEIPARPEIAVDTPKAKEMLASTDADLVSVRSWDEYIGKVSGYNYIEKKGRIPGAVFGNCGSDAYHMENYRNADHTMREYQEVDANWREMGLTPEKHLAFYCGTGWRGSEAFMNAYMMGWPKISVYDGGWFEWSNDPNNPIGTGEPE